MILGLGAGWQEREHHMFGYPLGDVATRMARFEEALEVVTRLVRSATPEPFEGQFFQLREGAQLLPRPARPGGTQIMIGGNGPKRTLPLAARYADIWNGVFLSMAAFRERTALLDGLLDQAGRPRSAVRRTLMVPVYFGRDEAELDRQLAWRYERPELADKPLHEAVAAMRERGMVVGGPDDMAAYMRGCDEAGVEEVFLQWLSLDDAERLGALAEALGPWLAPGA
jgi:alkanesulfonate monooxygenase SsuD/methylene tetrahydromethanopterin reductase-like flavin-dependent oxidoreductase (luciferase family)